MPRDADPAVQRVIMIGSGGVGKSAITLQYMYDEVREPRARAASPLTNRQMARIASAILRAQTAVLVWSTARLFVIAPCGVS